MRKIASIILIAFINLCLINFESIAENKSNETELNIFTGMFDFSDDKQRSGLLGLQHQMTNYLEKVF